MISTEYATLINKSAHSPDRLFCTPGTQDATQVPRLLFQRGRLDPVSLIFQSVNDNKEDAYRYWCAAVDRIADDIVHATLFKEDLSERWFNKFYQWIRTWVAGYDEKMLFTPLDGEPIGENGMMPP